MDFIEDFRRQAAMTAVSSDGGDDAGGGPNLGAAELDSMLSADAADTYLSDRGEMDMLTRFRQQILQGGDPAQTAAGAPAEHSAAGSYGGAAGTGALGGGGKAERLDYYDVLDQYRQVIAMPCQPAARCASSPNLALA